jgi:hypothetical protein
MIWLEEKEAIGLRRSSDEAISTQQSAKAKRLSDPAELGRFDLADSSEVVAGGGLRRAQENWVIGKSGNRVILEAEPEAYPTRLM